MAAYLVTITRKYPVYPGDGAIEVNASSKAEAVKIVKEKAKAEMWYDRLDGPIYYKAELIE